MDQAKRTIWTTRPRQTIQHYVVAQDAVGVVEAASCMRGVWLSRQCARPHHARAIRRGLLEGAVSKHVYAMPQRKECQRTETANGWWSYVNWTHQDYHQEIIYITYD
jgi:hypothetical protein